MKIFATLLLCMTILQSVHSQDGECGTPSSPDLLQPLRNKGLLRTGLGYYTIQVYLHFIRKDDGGGDNKVSIYDGLMAFINMQNIYRHYNICFSLIDYDEINNTDLYHYRDGASCSGIFSNESDLSTLISTNNHSNAIDIYYVPKNDWNCYNGTSEGIPSKAIVVVGTNSVNNGTTLPHEMGHCLGLYHTFEKGTCKECVTRDPSKRNCETCGDYICDTPADPYPVGWSISGCTYTGTVTDDCDGNLAFSPNVSNYMSYSGFCRSAFTPGQINRILTSIENNATLQNVLVPQNITLSNESYPKTITNDIVISYQVTTASGTLTAENITIQDGANIFYVAGEEISLNDGFSVEEGGEFYATIGFSCNPDLSNARMANPNIPNSIKGIGNLFMVGPKKNTRVSKKEAPKKNKRQNMNHVLSSRIINRGLFQPLGIEFDLPDKAVVTVTITDAAGEIMATPVNKQRYEKGTHEVVFTLPSQKTGGMFYKVTAEMASETLTERQKLK